MQACLLGEEDVQGVLVMCTYLMRLLSKLSRSHTLFSYVPEVHQLPPPMFHTVRHHPPNELHVYFNLSGCVMIVTEPNSVHDLSCCVFIK